MQIHIHREGQDFGPYTLEQVNQYLVEGSIVASDMAWYDGAPDWIPLPKVPGVIVPAGAAVAGAAATGGGKKTAVLISIAAVAAAAICGGIVFVMMNKGGGTGQSAEAGGSNGGGSGGNAAAGKSGGNSSGSGGDGMGMGMDGGMMSMDGDNMMGMEMGMDGGGADGKKVLALLEQKCFRCHGNGKSKGGYSLDSRSSALDAIKPGNPAGSRLLALVRRDDPDDAMPPKDSEALTKAEVAMVEAWIKAGAKW